MYIAVVRYESVPFNKKFNRLKNLYVTLCLLVPLYCNNYLRIIITFIIT